jgi:hypothetical protein
MPVPPTWRNLPKELQTRARACIETLYPIEMQASPADEAQHAASKKRNTPVACNAFPPPIHTLGCVSPCHKCLYTCA